MVRKQLFYPNNYFWFWTVWDITGIPKCNCANEFWNWYFHIFVLLTPFTYNYRQTQLNYLIF